MRQKFIKNSRYQPFTKQWLLDINVDVLLDGVSTKEIPTDVLRMFYYDYKTIEIRQWSNKFKKWFTKKPIPNTTPHEQGIIGQCTYYQISLSVPHQDSKGIPFHRIVYAWFHDEIPAYNEGNEKLEICHKERYVDPYKDCHITNLFLDTAAHNKAMRGGAVNQYGTRKEKYGIDVLLDRYEKKQ